MQVFNLPMLLTGGYSRLIRTPTPEAVLGLLASEQLNAFFCTTYCMDCPAARSGLQPGQAPAHG
jgi:hypothetical protein